MFDQIALSQQQRRVGSFNAWLSGAVAAVRVESGSPGGAKQLGHAVAILEDDVAIGMGPAKKNVEMSRLVTRVSG